MDGKWTTLNRMIIYLLCFSALAVTFTATACATTIVVNPGESIQAAIDSAVEGDVIELASGTWNLDTPINIHNKAGIVLRGQGMDGPNQSLLSNSLLEPMDVINVRDSSAITIKDLRIYKNGGTGRGGIPVFIQTNVTNSVIDHIKIEAKYTTHLISVGLQSTSFVISTDITISNCDLTNLGGMHHHYINLQETRDIKVINNTARGGAVYGIDIDGTSNSIIENNTITDADKGIWVYSGADYNIVRNNHVYDSGRMGIAIHMSKGNIIERNIVHDCPFAIVLSAQGHWCYDNTIRNNIIYNAKATWEPAGPGITIIGSGELYPRNTEISSNTIYNCVGGIVIDALTNQAVLKNNIVANNGGYGIRVANNPTVTVKYNCVWGNADGNYQGISPGEGDISADPLFADPANGFFQLQSQGGRWNPITKSWIYDPVISPCIDAGDPTSDYSNEPDYPDGQINSGAYGNTIYASRSVPTGPDTTPPYTSGHSPAKDATEVAKNTNIIVHIRDTGDGVDQSSIVMTVEGSTVTPTISGTPADYILTYNPPTDFDYNQVIDVTINARDLASPSNVLSQDNYSFTIQSTPDTTSPAAVTNLAATSPTSSSITLTWTAPGGDGNTGTASQYDIRYSTSPITDANWNLATQCTGEHTPRIAGSSESFMVHSLSPSTTYYFALKTADEVPNWSGISNSPSGMTSSGPQPEDVIIWDTNRHYTGNQFPMGEAFLNKAIWTQVPYGTTDYTFNGDAMIENEHFYLSLFSSIGDSIGVYAKYSGGNYGVQQGNELYKVYDTGTRDFGMGTQYTKILKNTVEEVIVEHAGIGHQTGQPVITTYHIPKKPWIEVKPVSRVNQQGMHAKSRLASFLFQNVGDDVILDGLKHGDFSENVYPKEGCIGEINLHGMRSSSSYDDSGFMYFLTFPPGAETNSLTYQGIHYPDPFWEDITDTPCVGANYAYLNEKVVIGVLNFKDNWKREGVSQYLNAGQTYTSSFTAPYAGKWRIFGVMSEDDYYITNYSSEVTVNAGDHFTFTSPISGTLEYLVIYMFDSTDGTPANIFTPMDVYRETIGVTPDTTPPVADAGLDQTMDKGTVVYFDGSGSTDNVGIRSYSWDFDSSDGIQQDSTGVTASHIYTEPDSYIVTLTVTDTSGNTDTDTCMVIVNASNNRAPILNQIGDKSIYEGSLLEFTISASDPDNDPRTYSADNLPTGATFDPAARTFSWTPDYGREGTYPDVHFEVTDGYLTDTENITITVNNATTVHIRLEAEDADEINPSMEIASDPSAYNGSYIWVPDGGGWKGPGYVRYILTITTPGDYKICGRVQAPTDANNSFLVRMDDDPDRTWTIPVTAKWGWDEVNHWGSGTETNPEIDPVIFTLSTGEHVLTIKHRESGTKLDRLLITNELEFVPHIPDTTPPVADAGPDQIVDEDTVVYFDGSGSTDNIGIRSYSWDFDASDGIQIDATGVTASHTYTEPGSYIVTLTVTDTFGNTDNDTCMVTVNAPKQMASHFGVNDTNGISGTYVLVPVNIVDVTDGPIQTIKFDILYDESVLNLNSNDPKSLQPGTLIGAGWWFMLGSNNHTITLTTAWQSLAIPDGSAGSVVLLNFSVIGAPGATSYMDISEIEFANTGNELGTAPAESGLFSVLRLGTMSGTIAYSCNNTAIAGAVVNLTKNGSLISSTTTDANGMYTFTDLEPGEYDVSVSKIHFWDNSTSVTVYIGQETVSDHVLLLRGDLNDNGEIADAADVNMMMQAFNMDIPGDKYFDLNENGKIADFGDVEMILRASIGELIL